MLRWLCLLEGDTCRISAHRVDARNVSMLTIREVDQAATLDSGTELPQRSLPVDVGADLRTNQEVTRFDLVVTIDIHNRCRLALTGGVGGALAEVAEPFFNGDAPQAEKARWRSPWALLRHPVTGNGVEFHLISAQPARDAKVHFRTIEIRAVDK